MSVDLERKLKEDIRTFDTKRARRRDLERVALAKEGLEWLREYRGRYGIIPLTELSVPSEYAFSLQERKKLIAWGATICTLLGLSVREQMVAGREYPLSGDKGTRYRKKLAIWELDSASHEKEVAVVLDQGKVLVPDSLNKPLAQQEKLLRQDAKALREELGLEGIDEVVPELSEVLELVHMVPWTEPGCSFPGRAEDGTLLAIRTKAKKMPDASSTVCVIGYSAAHGGRCITRALTTKGYTNLGLVRWIVKR